MIIIGIDPASRNCGIAVVNGADLLYSEQYKTGLKTGYSDQDLALELFIFFKVICSLIEEYNPNMLIIENTSVQRNLNTVKMLAFFEASAMMAGAVSSILCKRVRTKTARKEVCGRGNIPKEEAIQFIKDKYNRQDFGDDESEAIIFALCATNVLQ